MPIKPPAMTLPANPAAPVAGTSLVNVTTSVSKPGFAKEIEMSADRFATIAHGVTHAVGTSSPEIVASAPDGVDAMLMFSVVPRVIDAHPPSMAASATIPQIRINKIPKPDCIQQQPEDEINSNCTEPDSGSQLAFRTGLRRKQASRRAAPERSSSK